MEFLDLSLINCETELDLPWSKECIVSEIYKTPEVPANANANPPNPIIQVKSTSDVTLQIDNAKRYVPVVNLPINGNIKFLENLKQLFKGTISWNKYRSEITAQPNNHNSDYLNYLNYPTYRNIKR